jgi:hypothetical protein
MSHKPTSGLTATAALGLAALCADAYIHGLMDHPHPAAPKPVPTRTVVIHQVTHAAAFHWPVNGIELTIVLVVALGVACALGTLKILRPGRST